VCLREKEREREFVCVEREIVNVWVTRYKTRLNSTCDDKRKTVKEREKGHFGGKKVD